jgi:hypothetical protein
VLVERGPVCGLLETKGEAKLSSLAGCTLALILLRFRSDDKDAVELAKRLADFSLKGQHPRGLFYPYHWRDRRSWLPPDSPVSVSLQESAAIALTLLRFAMALKALGLPASVYLHAASHMADSLLASSQDLANLGRLLYPDSLLPAGPAAGSPYLVELLLELQKITGKDRYRKAVRSIRSTLFHQAPERLHLLGLENGAADLETLITETQTAVSLDESGYPVKGLPRYFDALLARVFLNRSDSRAAFNPVGGFTRVLGDPTLVFRGFELSHTLLTLDARMNKSTKLGELPLLIAQLLGFTLQRPPGTAYFEPDRKTANSFGSLSSTKWTRELSYMTRLFTEFREALPG